MTRLQLLAWEFNMDKGTPSFELSGRGMRLLLLFEQTHHAT